MFGTILFIVAIIAITLAVALHLDPQVIGPMDLNLRLITAGALTANTNGAAINLGTGFAPPAGGVPMLGIFPFSALDRVSGDETYTIAIQDSPDGSSWTTRATTTTAAEGFTTTGATGVILLGAFIRANYVRATLTVAGTTPSITFGDCFLQPKVNSIG